MYISCLLLTDKFCLSEFQKLAEGKRCLHRSEEMLRIQYNIYIQFNLIINPLNIKLFTIYKIFSTEYIT